MFSVSFHCMYEDMNMIRSLGFECERRKRKCYPVCKKGDREKGVSADERKFTIRNISGYIQS